MMCTHPALRGLAAALLLAGAVGGAHAAVTVQASDATGPAGTMVLPALSYDFSAPYALLSFGLQFSYDPVQLTFDAAASKVSLDGVSVSLAAALSDIPASELSVNYGVDGVTGQAFGDFSYIPNTSAAIDHQLVFMPAFHITASAQPGLQATVTFSGDLADDATGLETTFSTSALVTVSAVPEPAAWLSMASGLLLLGALARRRRKA